MMNPKSSGAVISTSVLSAIAASLCCITSVIALLAGSSSIAANLAWIEPTRPYLIVLSGTMLAFAWFQKLIPITKNTDCDCSTTKKTSFFQSKTFLGVVTVFTVLVMSFPLYANVFYAKPTIKAQAVNNNQQVGFNIQGMTCKGCEDPIDNELSKNSGILAYKTSYAIRSSMVTFDKSKTDVKGVEAAINKTGYKVKGYDFMNTSKSAVSFR